jgi:hypothetical protein
MQLQSWKESVQELVEAQQKSFYSDSDHHLDHWAKYIEKEGNYTGNK